MADPTERTDEENDRGSLQLRSEKRGTSFLFWFIIILQFGFLCGLVAAVQRQRADMAQNVNPRNVVIPVKSATVHEAGYWLRNGQFDRALLAYDALSEGKQLPVALQYQRALCLEAVGQIDSALSEFRALSGRDLNRAQRLASVLGIIRCHLRNRSLDEGHLLVETELAKGSELLQLPENLLTELVYLGGFSKVQLDPKPLSPNLAMTEIVAYPFDDDVLRMIEWFIDTAPAEEADANAAVDPPSKTLASLIAQVATKAQRNSLTNLLTAAVASEAYHPLADNAQLALGNFYAGKKQYDEAKLVYAEMMSDGLNSRRWAAAFNTGAINLVNKLPNEAEISYMKIVDGNPAHPLTPPSLLRVGRIRLNRGDWEEGAAALVRCLSMRPTRRVAGTAVAYISVGLTGQNNRRDDRLASEFLFTYRKVLDNSNERALAAALASLARYRTLPEGTRRIREADYVVNGLFATDFDKIDPSAVVVLSRAFNELEVFQPLIERGERTLKREMQPILADELRFYLGIARYHTSKDAGLPESADEAIQDLKYLSETGIDPWSRRARNQLAEIALSEHRPDDCLFQCRKALELNSPDQSAILRLMGRAYELLGERELAAKCFSGQVPQSVEQATSL